MKIAYTISTDSRVKWRVFQHVETNEKTILTSEETLEGANLPINETSLRERMYSLRKLDVANNIYVVREKDGTMTFIPKMPFTYFSKAGGVEFITAHLRNVPTIAQLYIPFADSPYSDWAMRINIKEDQEEEFLSFFPNAEKVEATQEAYADFYYNRQPGLRVVFNDANGVVVQLTKDGNDLAKEGVRIFAKSSSGYIPVREQYTNAQGQVTFKPKRTELEASDVMVAEFGFKFVSNLANATIS